MEDDSNSMSAGLLAAGRLPGSRRPFADEAEPPIPVRLPDAPAGGRRKYKSVIVSVCSFILVTEFCERLAYYGLSGSLPIFFTKQLGLTKVWPRSSRRFPL